MTTQLPDEAERRRVLSDLDSTLLVEAGAGTGKTALLAGRVAMLLAAGIPAREIVAITFTEAAASELLVRINTYVQQLLMGQVPTELKVALPTGPTPSQIESLRNASSSIDELTCSTVHSFCQQITRPFPVEASLDPGAVVLDDEQGSVSWGLLFERWLHQRLDDADANDPLSLFLLEEAGDSLSFIRSVAEAFNHRRDTTLCQHELTSEPLTELHNGVEGFEQVLSQASAEGINEGKTAECLEGLRRLAAFFPPQLDPNVHFRALWRMCLPQRHVPSPEDIFTKTGQLRKYPRCKGSWEKTAKQAGKLAARGAEFNTAAAQAYDRVAEALRSLIEMLGEAALSQLVSAVHEFSEYYRRHKRLGAVLDFDDLLINARDLLRNSPDVRAQLANRYRHVLVDEFQDTDPIQAEILFLVCGENVGDTPWWGISLRPGQLFLVGDPKQSIYRFRRADIACYERVRKAFLSQSAESKVEITTNFRSVRPILDFVNSRFAQPLDDIGFAPLSCPGDDGPAGQPHITQIEISCPEGDSASERRRAEATQVARYCRSLLGTFPVRKGEDLDPCQPQDIALLAPTGTDLWTYEQALDDEGIPLTTQAGKGFFNRQEIQDLIAITRVLSSRRDSLALGALLRGPLVGLTEEELLDIVATLPRKEQTGEFGWLTLDTDPAVIDHPVARRTIEILRKLSNRAYNTSPFDILSQAVEELYVRPLLKLRHGHHPDRSLVNVDLFLEFSRQYNVRGLRDFARGMMERWRDSERQMEGRADAGAEAVQIVTLHSAKGLEWPVVIPINMSTETHGASGVLFDNQKNILLCEYGPIELSAYSALKVAEDEQRHRERIRMWYVCCTRARDLLAIPHHVNGNVAGSWFGEVDLEIDKVPVAAFPESASYARLEEKDENPQTTEVFQKETGELVQRTRRIRWTFPSADDPERPGERVPPVPVEQRIIEGEPPKTPVAGSLGRGQILHKLMEEVLLGATEAAPAPLVARTKELIAQLGLQDSSTPGSGISSGEMCDVVLKTLSLPLVQQYLGRLQPEWNIYSYVEGEEPDCEATCGVADAVVYSDANRAEMVFDWKSNVASDAATKKRHSRQLQEYLQMTRCSRGAVVYMTTGEIQEVAVADSSQKS